MQPMKNKSNHLCEWAFHFQSHSIFYVQARTIYTLCMRLCVSRGGVYVQLLRIAALSRNYCLVTKALIIEEKRAGDKNKY